MSSLGLVTSAAGVRVTRAIAGSARWAYQMLPSGPRVMPVGPPPALKPGATPPVRTWVVLEPGHRRPSRPGAPGSVNHSAPSPPSAMSRGCTPAGVSETSPAVSIRPIREAAASVKYSFSSPATIDVGAPSGVRPSENSVIAPVPGSMRPMRPGSAASVNHSLPSGPAAMSAGSDEPDSPELNSVMSPSGVMRPIAPFERSANQRLPSGPTAMPAGSLFGVSPSVNSVTVSVTGSKRPIAPVASVSVNHSAPSGPATMSAGWASAVKPGTSPARNSVIAPAVVIRPIAPGEPCSVNHTAPSGPAVMPAGAPVRPGYSTMPALAVAGTAWSASTRAAAGSAARRHGGMSEASAPHGEA